MKKYLLDTNICIFLMKGKYGVKERIVSVGIENCFMSVITLAELYFGAAFSGHKEEKMVAVSELEELFDILSIRTALDIFADDKAFLRHEGLLIDDFDLLIGATAKANQMVLVTDNVKHLSRIPDIQIENWVVR